MWFTTRKTIFRPINQIDVILIATLTFSSDEQITILYTNKVVVYDVSLSFFLRNYIIKYILRSILIENQKNIINILHNTNNKVNILVWVVRQLFMKQQKCIQINMSKI